jgi:hypothetical protein
MLTAFQRFGVHCSCIFKVRTRRKGTADRFIHPAMWSSAGYVECDAKGGSIRLLQKNLKSRTDGRKAVNWNFLQLRTEGVTYESSQFVRKELEW